MGPAKRGANFSLLLVENKHVAHGNAVPKCNVKTSHFRDFCIIGRRLLS